MKFKDVTDNMVELHDKKNADYGDSFTQTIRKYGLIAALVRLEDKLNRASNLVLSGNNSKVSDESIKDTIIDLACYAVMTVVVIENGEVKKKNDH